jgi:hypothetical protein
MEVSRPTFAWTPTERPAIWQRGHIERCSLRARARSAAGGGARPVCADAASSPRGRQRRDQRPSSPLSRTCCWSLRGRGSRTRTSAGRYSGPPGRAGAGWTARESAAPQTTFSDRREGGKRVGEGMKVCRPARAAPRSPDEVARREGSWMRAPTRCREMGGWVWVPGPRRQEGGDVGGQSPFRSTKLRPHFSLSRARETTKQPSSRSPGPSLTGLRSA